MAGGMQNEQSFLKDTFRASVASLPSHPGQQEPPPRGQLNGACYSKKSSDQNALTYFIDLPGVATPQPFPEHCRYKLVLAWRGKKFPAFVQLGMSHSQHWPIPGAEECQNYLWSLCGRQAPRQQHVVTLNYCSHGVRETVLPVPGRIATQS
ncbi:hypothetical protein KIL84_004431 [Mauremys mutica]|uniref:Uncharacterized protein n=1 Tax=Mauremys mutica TaxID=74926 RepID=A0A9D4B7E3_9SAUR|nr:hypothetical protein KIL84_004431 [Mauremys mutica]